MNDETLSAFLDDELPPERVAELLAALRTGRARRGRGTRPADDGCS
jgi:hypothetical protein